MKKLLLCLLAILLTIPAFAYDFEKDGIYYNITGNSTVEVTNRSSSYKYSGNVNIPSAVVYQNNEYTVTSIGGSAFYRCTGLTSVTIPNSVTEIGNSAFSGCTGLTSVTIPNSVTEIDSYAFSGCTGLTSVNIGNSVTSIGSYAFSGCTGLTSVNIGNSVTSIGGSAFSGCTGLTSITIPNSVTSIGGSAFYRCTGLTSITIPNSVTEIGYYAFEACTGLMDIEEIQTTNTTITFKVNKFNIKIFDKNNQIATPNIYVSIIPSLDLGKLEIEKEYTAAHLRADQSYSIVIGYGNLTNLTNSIKIAQFTTQRVILKVSQGASLADRIYFTMYLDNNIDFEGNLSTGCLSCWGAYNGYVYVDENGNGVIDVAPSPQKRYIDYYGIYSPSYINLAEGRLETEPLKWGTPVATATSFTSARLMAEANLSNFCTTAGIEWRRNDAPSNVPSTKVPCAVVDGLIVGTLRNLRDDVYYQFRPYVEGESGNIYYGEWVGFYTGDATVYFDPEVRTYVPSVKENSVTFTGYALEGTDNITEQGFEYKPSSQSRAGETGWTRVKASGILMSATVEGLNGDYVVRSYADTSKGTYYGDEQVFNIDFAGIDNITIDAAEPEIIGYFDLNGRRHDEPVKGLNIVVYSNGTSRKVVYRGL